MILKQSWIFLSLTAKYINAMIEHVKLYLTYPAQRQSSYIRCIAASTTAHGLHARYDEVQSHVGNNVD